MAYGITTEGTDNLGNFINSVTQNIHFITANITTALYFVGILWAVFLLRLIVGRRLLLLGVRPRRWLGLLGIPFYTFLHVDFGHLFFNSIPLVVLISFILTEGMHQFLYVSATIILLGGVLIWLFARSPRGVHVGASCLVMGYLSYLLVHAYYNPSVLSVGLGFVCFYYFGSLLFSIFPQEEKVSWEGHLFGFLAGIVAAYVWG